MTRRVTTPALVAHHLRSRSGGSLTVAALVLVLSLLATAAPLALGLLADSALRDRLGSLGALDRDVEATTAGLPQVGSGDAELAAETRDVWGGFTAALENVRMSADPVLEELLAPARTVALVTDNAVLEDPRTLALSLAFDPAVDGSLEIAEGRMPDPATLVQDESGSETGARMEVAMSADLGRADGVAVGETRTIGTAGLPTEIVLTGTFDAADDEDDYWRHVPSVLQAEHLRRRQRPAPRDRDRLREPRITAVRRVRLPGRASTVVWYPLDTALIDAASASDTAAALRKFTAISQPSAPPPGEWAS